MSKKKKKKYYQQTVSNSVNTANAVVAGAGSVAAVASPVVDKQASVYSAHEEEYRMVRSDLIRVALVNGLFLAAVLALYYVNRSNPFLEAWYKKLF